MTVKLLRKLKFRVSESKSWLQKNNNHNNKIIIIIKKYVNLWYKLLTRINSLKQAWIWDSDRFPRQGLKTQASRGLQGHAPLEKVLDFSSHHFLDFNLKNIFWLINQSTRVMSSSTIRVLNSWTRAEYKETDGTGLNLEHFINLCIYYEVSDQSVCKMVVTGVDPHLLNLSLFLLFFFLLLL